MPGSLIGLANRRFIRVRLRSCVDLPGGVYHPWRYVGAGFPWEAMTDRLCGRREHVGETSHTITLGAAVLLLKADMG